MGWEDDVDAVLEALRVGTLHLLARERPLITQRGCRAPGGIHTLGLGQLPFSEASTRGARRPRTRNPPIIERASSGRGGPLGR